MKFQLMAIAVRWDPKVCERQIKLTSKTLDGDLAVWGSEDLLSAFSLIYDGITDKPLPLTITFLSAVLFLYSLLGLFRDKDCFPFYLHSRDYSDYSDYIAETTYCQDVSVLKECSYPATLLINHRYHGKCQFTENSFTILVT